MIIVFRSGSAASSPLVNTASFAARFGAVSTGFDLSVPNATGTNKMTLPVDAVLAGDEPRLLPLGSTTLEAGGKKFTVRNSTRGY